MSKQTPKLNPKWVKEALIYFKKFLKETKFPHPENDNNGGRGRKFNYPEWLIMFIAVLSVRAKVKSYLGIHKLTLKYWSVITKDLSKAIREKPISERQLRDRLKKICHSPREPAVFIFQIFPPEVFN